MGKDVNVFYRIEEDLGIIEFDRPDSKVNLVDSPTMQTLGGILAEIEKNTFLKAVILVSKKENIFIAGADIKEIESITDPKEGERKSREGQLILNRLEDLKIPTVAVVDGVALGGGCELALACRYRVTTFNDKVKIGLPEVNLGFVPGFGGTYRLPRLVGLAQASKMILAGKQLSAKEALKVGLVDRIFPQKGLDQYLRRFVAEVLQSPIRRKRGPRKAKFPQKFLEETFTGRALLFHQTRKLTLGSTKGFYPAPMKALDVVAKTVFSSREKALALEAKTFGELAVTDVSKNLVKVFYLTEKFKKLTVPEAEHIKPATINRCAVLGAGVMGGGIAQLLSHQGIWVRLKDINYDAVAKGLKAAQKIFAGAVEKKKMEKFEADVKMGHITGTIDYSGFRHTDMVIEAVIENMDVKRKVFKELSAVCSPDTILCTNTSALSVTEMAKETKDPSKVIGLHFFNPVHRMPLIEIVTTTVTSHETLATTLQLTRRLGKTPIVVKDSCGFIVNRILLSYINEAGRILEEGANIDEIDALATSFGLPMGPLLLSDEVGLDVGYKVLLILEEGLGERFKPAGIFKKVYEQKWLGKKSGEGFYLHGARRTPNPRIFGLIERGQGVSSGSKLYLERMLYIMINEAARCLQEKIVEGADAIDVGMILGCGFPPFRGGLLRYADRVGLNKIVETLKQFEQTMRSGRFTPGEYLLDLARCQKKFFDQ